MKLFRVTAMARKESLHILRDWRSLGMGIAMPMLLLFLFGYALSLDVDKVPLVVLDRSGTPESRELASRFTGSPYFSLRSNADSYRQVEQAIDRREALIALIIPTDFSDNLASGKPAAVQVIVDGSDAGTATIARGYAEAVVGGFSGEILLRETSFRPPLELRPRIWFNPEMLSRHSIVPGLIAVIMMVIAALLTSLAVAREWENGTMEQLLATPVTASELVVGKLLPYIGIGLFDLVVAVAVGRYAFGVPLRGNVFLLLALSTLFLVGALTFGLLISIVTRNQLLSSQIALVTTMLPAFLLSGFIFPIENMPAPIRAITHIITARYMVTILRGIYLKESGIGLLAAEVGLLALFSVVVLLLAVKLFRNKID